MTLDIMTAGALVPGSKLSEGSMEMATIKVLRAFFYEKEVQPKGKIFSLPKARAVEFVSMNKAQIVPEPPQPPPPKGAKAEQPKPDKVPAAQKKGTEAE